MFAISPRLLRSLRARRIGHVLLTLSLEFTSAPAAIRAWAGSGVFTTMSGVLPSWHGNEKGHTAEGKGGASNE